MRLRSGAYPVPLRPLVIVDLAWWPGLALEVNPGGEYVGGDIPGTGVVPLLAPYQVLWFSDTLVKTLVVPRDPELSLVSLPVSHRFPTCPWHSCPVPLLAPGYAATAQGALLPRPA